MVCAFLSRPRPTRGCHEFPFTKLAPSTLGLHAMDLYPRRVVLCTEVT
jgi:hypothetical protein